MSERTRLDPSVSTARSGGKELAALEQQLKGARQVGSIDLEKSKALSQKFSQALAPSKKELVRAAANDPRLVQLALVSCLDSVDLEARTLQIAGGRLHKAGFAVENADTAHALARFATGSLRTWLLADTSVRGQVSKAYQAIRPELVAAAVLEREMMLQDESWPSNHAASQLRELDKGLGVKAPATAPSRGRRLSGAEQARILDGFSNAGSDRPGTYAEEFLARMAQERPAPSSDGGDSVE